MPGNTFYWNSPDFESDESLPSNFPKTSYVDPWDLENYAYIREHLDSLEVNSDTSSFGEPVEASSFYYAPLKQDAAKNFDSLIDSEYGTAKYAEIEEIYDTDADKRVYGIPSMGLNYEDRFFGTKSKRSSSTTAHDHLNQPKIPVRRRMSYSFGDHGRSRDNAPQLVYHSTDDKQKLKKSPMSEERFHPNNFGLSTYGHLKIDYSFSWDNLNRYISN
ncbi:hypothetical protein PPYR_11560 [Photinus pyralis]|uniref:Uncharacterized protein n=1 Tax=Photinus pyralis TaxID=7054 RepID=A0A5N4ABN3_PHOPY|nr:uncharacterized protein LOC116175399 [Photinus pyralis]XP_031349362.1 uncharacterized protein LOC116175399 [Photinus pyralis]KAB0794721.1 hypothetical protein PPYR_11560 [Photinus pyralis]